MNIHQQLKALLAAADCHQLPAVYAGIGSRETPNDILDLMRRIAKHLETAGFVLRSGGAGGADEAFDTSTMHSEIFLPWLGFTEYGKRKSPLPQGPNIIVRNAPTENARAIAAQYHPRWTMLSDSVRALQARNTHQILGWTCDAPSTFVVCWTPDGAIGVTSARTGGTGQAIRIAHDRNIPIFNLQRDDHREAWEGMMR